MKSFPILEHPACFCGACGRVLNKVLELRGPAAYTLCVFCLAPLIFPPDGGIFFEVIDLATVTDEVREAFARTRELVTEVHRERRAARESLH